MSNISSFTLRGALLVLLIVLGSGMTGCSGGQVVTSAEIAVDAAEAALPAIATAAGLPDAVKTAILDYLEAANTALSQAGAILAAGGTTASMASQIAQAFAGVAAPVLPKGTPANVAAAVQTLATAVAHFVKQFPAPAALPKLLPAPVGGDPFLEFLFEAPAAPAKPVKVKLTDKMRMRLAALRSRADGLVVRVRMLRK